MRSLEHERPVPRTLPLSLTPWSPRLFITTIVVATLGGARPSHDNHGGDVVSHARRLNKHRASGVLESAACRTYPTRTGSRASAKNCKDSRHCQKEPRGADML